MGKRQQAAIVRTFDERIKLNDAYNYHPYYRTDNGELIDMIEYYRLNIKLKSVKDVINCIKSHLRDHIARRLNARTTIQCDCPNCERYCRHVGLKFERNKSVNKVLFVC